MPKPAAAMLIDATYVSPASPPVLLLLLLLQSPFATATQMMLHHVAHHGSSFVLLLCKAVLPTAPWLQLMLLLCSLPHMHTCAVTCGGFQMTVA